MDYYFLFDSNDMPLAIFKTETPEESQELFCKLYISPWSRMTKAGMYMKKEGDVPAETWDEIHRKYKTREEKKVIPVVAPKVIHIEKLKTKPHSVAHEQGSTILETAKYLGMF